ncbi:MAG: hypothetical protein A2233_04445 [Candidatus Kerfeldbacteria bacterium RIFOXYA2_FULL_38_24]|uniref:Hexokinase N-terminal domain-containing protein n=1 Tax=Candidatus Kerfeldbacteria bacterium RIFOXYB2_FULL_38_14 TaxID=1798547 RepID=A0A1G2BAV0_9BACT|nr:MAG: hypothetical protein A2233_04445 [Candidatus Kerfeldbacteria bacterium RIFOXYA2_FULL_38_24]OGY86348.1 MAG: hypothetical protein A2319_03045 [Candidatus Kerfeldbacteria bacterium RIFOXYB2_FULL_38_14]OGY89855.1 MAG: hypothetical protein A2458_05005 [Candidatus Kerfeldbacteria bacterium RIFOXYC2_FULL_38_9]
MSKQKYTETISKLDYIGIRAFTARELHQLMDDLSKAIEIGIKREGPKNASDHGLLAFPTGIKPISQDSLTAVPDGQKVITCACGGTNWVFTVATKQKDGNVKLGEESIRPILEQERVHTLASLIDIIATEIYKVAKIYDLLEVANLPIAVSFGFPQTTMVLKNGDIDARLNRKNLVKFWQITDIDETLAPEDQPSITEALRAALIKKGLKSVGAVVIVNDTVAVAFDVQHVAVQNKGGDLPVGFVFGTGTNATMYSGDDKGFVNLEAGHAHIMPDNLVYQTMEKLQLIPECGREVEFWLGGGFLPARLAAMVHIFSDFFTDAQQVSSVLTAGINQALISDIAQNISPKDIHLRVGPYEYRVLVEAAQRVLVQAGQLCAVMIASVASATGYQKGKAFVPYEGSLLGKGYQVAETTEKTLKILLPESDITPYHAFGLSGVAKLAMWRSLEKRFDNV